MAKKLSTFESLENFSGIYTARKDQLRCNAIVLKSGKLCLHSPVLGLNDDAQSSLAEIGEVAFLLAPNHYHNRGLCEYSEAFPDALIVAPGACHSRLEKQTGLEFLSLSVLLDDMPDNIKVISPEGLKTGEIWLVIEEEGQKALCVVDAFCGDKSGVSSKEAKLLGTFPKYGLKAKEIYHEWFEDFIKVHQLSLLLPSHGSIVRNVDLNDQLTDLVVGL